MASEDPLRNQDKSGDNSTASNEVQEELLRTREALCRKENELSALMNGSRAVLEKKGFPEAARSIFNYCAALTGATCGYVALLNGDTMENELVFLNSGGLPWNVDPRLSMPVRGMRAVAYSSSKPVFENDFRTSRWAALLPEGHALLDNVMFAPLVLNGDTVGIIGLANKSEGFDDNDARMVSGFGQLAAMALQNSRNEDAIREKNQTLQKAIADLGNMQTQLIQSEKMASLGLLAAGVAHEINNPTGFISSNLKTLTDYQSDLIRLIAQYRKLKDSVKNRDGAVSIADLGRMIPEIEAIEDDIDIDFLHEDIGELIDECRQGTDRIKQIVEDLKHFAHPGQDKIQDTDINRELEATLNVVNNELKYKAKVIKALNPLPVISANPQQLNQVFVNLLVNAAQAIENHGEITITTQAANGHVRIRISDTGCGIPEENLSRIFDAFFTTKAVGIGTGLGMNIVHNIIKKHQGEIRVESTVGVGTTFTIDLPARLLED